MESYRVVAQVGGAEIELPCTTPERALAWMRDFSAANPGSRVVVYSPRGEVIAAQTAPVRQ